MTTLRLNASCVALHGLGVIIEGPPGSGKSSLALALIDRGASLVGDDGFTLELREGRLWAAPPPRCAGKLEIRNVGIVDLPAISAPLALVVRLDGTAPRQPDRAERTEIEGLELPLLRLFPDTPILALRVEWAARIHGSH